MHDLIEWDCRVFIPEKTRPFGADNLIIFSGIKLGSLLPSKVFIGGFVVNDSQCELTRVSQVDGCSCEKTLEPDN